MDFNQLLNTSTPFDSNKLNLLEQVVNVLYTTTNNNDVRENINISLYFYYFYRDKLQIHY